ncbi:MAG TPA: putative baseplate assembly protein [bacterium]|nr:MAG: hypothetical protein BWY28_02222 [bacterium ADurb.Bin236]HOY62322.1 putative baseplate assembly protein [bacterium]HPI77659.1 putative baseplate assembly protein [bacterium]HPN94744.1 putative baseplate assembly protein [bacterium]
MPELDVSRLVNFSKQIDYTSLDWLSFLSDMVDRIPQLTPEWTDHSASDQGIVILELVAFALDALSYRCDIIANEAYIQTAVLRKSVLNLAKMIDYTPAPAVSAVADLVFTITPQPIDFVIPKGAQISTQPTGLEQSYVFETMKDLVIPAGETTGAVAAIEGETKREILGSSAGLPAQFFELSFKPLSYSPDGACSLEIYVAENGVEERWTLAPSLLDSNPSEKSFEIEIDENDIVTVNFGDNQNGKIPAPGMNNVRAVYRVGGGARGNVGANKINRMITSVSEVSSVTNPAQAAGGVDRESVESVKRMAPKMLRTLWRAVTAEDYKTLAEALPGVAKAAVLCAPPGQAAYWGQVNLYIAPEGGGPPSPELKQMVEDYLADREMLNATTVVFDPVYVPVNVTMEVAVKENYMRLDIENLVREKIEKFFYFPNVDFGQSVFMSDLIAAVDGIEGVRYVNLTVLSRDETGVGNVIIRQDELPQLGLFSLDAFGGII